MAPPSASSTAVFVLLVLGLAVLLVAGVHRAGAALGERAAVRRRHTLRAAFGVAGDDAVVRLESASLRALLFEGAAAAALIARGAIEIGDGKEALLVLLRAVV